MSYSEISNQTCAAARWLPALAFITFPTAALAYVGPGAGLSLIGSLLAFLAAIVLAVFGFLFFPIRRLLRKRKQTRAARDAAETATPDSAESGAATEPATADTPPRDSERQ